MVRKLVVLPVLVALACVVAGAYGAAHNQLSYTIAPEYFHGLKFQQFRIPGDLHNRLGAAIVGWRASWWTGVFLGGVVAVAALTVRGGVGAFTRIFVRALFGVIAGAAVVGGLTLLVAFTLFTRDQVASLPQLASRADPLAFARAGALHDATYIGAGLATAVAVVLILRAAVRSRR